MLVDMHVELAFPIKQEGKSHTRSQANILLLHNDYHFAKLANSVQLNAVPGAAVAVECACGAGMVILILMAWCLAGSSCRG